MNRRSFLGRFISMGVASSAATSIAPPTEFIPKEPLPSGYVTYIHPDAPIPEGWCSFGSVYSAHNHSHTHDYAHSHNSLGHTHGFANPQLIMKK